MRKQDPERNSPEYKAWRKAVLKRDKNKCQMPGCTRRRKLQTHHIQRFADAPFLRNVVSNGITLCGSHHYQIRNDERNYIVMFMEIVRDNNE